MNYYLASNPNRSIAGCRFEQTDVLGGLAFGVYSTEKLNEISDLNGCCNNPSAGVESITEAQFILQKKSILPAWAPWPIMSSNSKPAVPHTSEFPQSIKGNGNAVVVECPTPIGSFDSIGKELNLDSVLEVSQI